MVEEIGGDVMTEYNPAMAYRIGAWCGPVGMILFGIAIAPFALHFLGPIPPSLPADQVAAFYRDNANAIRAGAIFGIAAAAALGGFTAAIAAQIKRIEGPTSPCAYMQLSGGILSIIGFLVPPLLWVVAAYRPERSAEEIVLLNDMAWTLLVMPAWTGLLQLSAIAIAILLDRSAQPLFPRWLAFLCIWAELMFLPALLMGYFQHGPFAWNGILSFWLAAIAFTVWIVCMCVCMLKAARVDR